MSQPSAYKLLDTYVHLGDSHVATPLEVNESFWPDLTSGKFDHLGPGRLVSFYQFDSDWDSWEVHPNGDEFVFLFSGSMDFVLDLPEGHTTVPLRTPGEFLLVPRGTWHTARVLAPSSALFVTDGEGTDHRPA